ncbi:transglycosylase SLT domain-containing protein [Sphingomicrobium astaxanthinifaciens]|uniref:transglycosylase SLT domain-containing protein n=1 Tax=Sphingomicrobium astaxanthinifaciens TaxID=1227949 RepID=UPI001FCA4DE8|nr:transglycosylase SLT domain-containing protein [Sphingomicrobium astaxanthinifaciens]MCJ7420388.1 transglycosylase SLT domain-containing protein [Sphingomicrobium astaxanthinifaciens]
MTVVNAVGHTPRSAAALRAIADAARATGVDFDYLYAQAKMESGLDPSAKASTSNAAGLFQFIPSTWQTLVARYGNRHGLSSDSGQHLSARFNPHSAALMAAELANENGSLLEKSFGRSPTATELYVAHFLGASDAQTFFHSLNEHPDQNATSLLPRAAQANPAIFLEAGRERSVGEVFELIDGRMSRALSSNDLKLKTDYISSAAVPSQHHYSISGQPMNVSRLPGLRVMAPSPDIPSMAATISQTFGSQRGNETSSSLVKKAYAKFEAFGL